MNDNKLKFLRTVNQEDLQQIIKLQTNNLPERLSNIEQQKEGFVTVKHTIKQLQAMQNKEPHCIIKDQNKVVAYALCMCASFKKEIPLLKPMFDEAEKHFKDSNNIKYIAMGQICIDKAYRGKGLFKKLYRFMATELSNQYQAIITEVDSKNTRSLQAHYAAGFTDLTIYKSHHHKWHLIALSI